MNRISYKNLVAITGTPDIVYSRQMTGNSQQSLFADDISLPEKIGAARVSASSIQTILNVGRGSTASFDFTLNAYRGCTFGCAYCYAPSFEGREAMAEQWGKWVEVKEQAVEGLTGVDLRGKSIFMSSVTDPYQPIEAKIGLTRKIVEILLKSGAQLVVQTRSPLVIRDLDLLREFERVKVNLSIPTESDAIRRIYEPSAPSIRSRLATATKLVDAGIAVSICISPMLPVLHPEKFAEMVNQTGAQRVTATWFHRSSKPFTATTRGLAIALNAARAWNYDRFSHVCDVLRETCPAYSDPGSTFGPTKFAA